MKFSERVRALDLPLDQVVVIGSGLLDQLHLRRAHDIDLVVSPQLFTSLKASGTYHFSARKGGDEVLEVPGLEVWNNWYTDQPYETLRKEAIAIDGVYFVSPSTLIARKRERGTPKDLRDIDLIREYQTSHPLFK